MDNSKKNRKRWIDIDKKASIVCIIIVTTSILLTTPIILGTSIVSATTETDEDSPITPTTPAEEPEQQEPSPAEPPEDEITITEEPSSAEPLGLTGSNATLVGNQTLVGNHSQGEVAVQPEPIGRGGEAARCNGVWVSGPGGSGFCFTNLEPDKCTLQPITVEDPPFCGGASIIVPGTTSTICAPTVEGNNTTTMEGGGGNQSTSEVEMLIDEACMTLQNNENQDARLQLNLVLYASVISNSNVTTTAGDGNAANATGGGTTGEVGSTESVITSNATTPSLEDEQSGAAGTPQEDSSTEQSRRPIGPPTNCTFPPCPGEEEQEGSPLPF